MGQRADSRSAQDANRPPIEGVGSVHWAAHLDLVPAMRHLRTRERTAEEQAYIEWDRERRSPQALHKFKPLAFYLGKLSTAISQLAEGQTDRA